MTAATGILEKIGRGECGVVPEETTLVGRIRIRSIIDLGTSALRFGIQRVGGECMVRGLATFVVVATVDDIGVNA